MINIERIRILLICTETMQKNLTFMDEVYSVSSFTDVQIALQELAENPFDILILDHEVFKDDLTQAVEEMKRQFAFLSIIVIADEGALSDLMHLLSRGADDVMPYDTRSSEWHRSITLLMKQKRQKVVLSRRNNRLRSVADISQSLQMLTEPRQLIQQTIDQACQSLDLYGIAILLTEGNDFQLYAGTKDTIEKSGLFESNVALEDHHPFVRTLNMGFSQIYGNIALDPFYQPILAVPDAEAVIMTPLKYQGFTTGVMTIYAKPDQNFSNADLVIYELLASSFVVAYNNVRYYYAQNLDFQFSQHLLRAWKNFAATDSLETIATTLRHQTQDVPSVSNSLVWFYLDEPDESDKELIVAAVNENIENNFHRLYDTGEITRKINEMGEQLYTKMPLTQLQRDPLSTLFQVSVGQELLILTVTDSARIVGGLMVTISGSYELKLETINLIRGIAQVAGQAWERTTLVKAMEEKSNRLEAILLSVSEGIFFVDGTGKVAFCNLQFTELTGISRNQVLGESATVLVDALADVSNNVADTRTTLNNALRDLEDPDTFANRNYLLEQITLTNPDRMLYIEFILLDSYMERHTGWIGVIRSQLPGQAAPIGNSVAFDLLTSQTRLPFSEIRSSLSMLLEQHSRFSHQERGNYLGQLRQKIDGVWTLWDSLIEFNRVQSDGLPLERSRTDVSALVNRVIYSQAMQAYNTRPEVQSAPDLPRIEVDEFRIEQAVQYILQSVLQLSNMRSAIAIDIESNDSEVILTYKIRGGLTTSYLEDLMHYPSLENMKANQTENSANIALYIAREIVQAHSGRIWVRDTTNSTIIGMNLPIGEGEVITVTSPSLETGDLIPPQEGLSAPSRNMRTIMVVQGRTQLLRQIAGLLEQQDYELVIYDEGSDALRDIDLIRLDLILLDTELPDMDGLQVCTRMRKRSEVPVMLFSDNQIDRTQGLKAGADEFITPPMDLNEVMARIDIVFNRQKLADRVMDDLEIGDLRIDFARRQVFLHNKAVPLTRIEYDILRILALNMGQVITHEQLLQKVWGPEHSAEKQYLWVNISRLRKKLEPTTDSVRYIHNELGVGYVFN